MTPTRTLLSSAVLLAVACASLSGCQGGSGAAAAAGPATHSPAPSATASAAPPSAPPATSTGHGTGGTGTDAASTVAPCGNGDLRTSWGYGTQSQPLQAGAVVFTNVSNHACTLKGYPGTAIANAGTVINATRVLNGYRDDQPPLKSPPLVTLAPGAAAHAMAEWLTYNGHACYPAGTGTFEITAPDTTNTILLSRPLMGRQGICSSLQINPVLPGPANP